MSTLRSAIVIAAGVVFAFAQVAYADKPDKAEKPPEGMGKYYLFIKEAPPVHPGQKPKKIVEPDIAKLGGRLLESKDNYRVVFLPFSALKHLHKDENVDYVQRVWMGEDLATWESPESGASAQTGPRLTTMSDDEGPTWGPKAYAYDGSGNIRQIASDTYAYDAVARLKQAVVSGKTETYQYDAFGNLTSKQITGEPASTIAVDGASNRIANATYDIAGNLKGDGRRNHWYDSMGMLAATTTGSPIRRMIYTADDERIGVKLDDYTTGRWHFRDFQGRVIREYRTDVFLSAFEYATWFWTQDWVYAGGQLVGGETAGPWGVTGGATVPEDRRRRHYHLDHLGTVRLITTDARQSLGSHTYYPFGAEQTVFYQESANYGSFGPLRPEPMRFTSHERDYDGSWNTPNNDQLDYMHARFYDPHAGRFLSVDPGDDTDPRQPQSWNKYSYVRNNPVNAADPTGMQMSITVTAPAPLVDPMMAERLQEWSKWFWGLSTVQQLDRWNQQWGDAFEFTGRRLDPNCGSRSNCQDTILAISGVYGGAGEIAGGVASLELIMRNPRLLVRMAPEEIRLLVFQLQQNGWKIETLGRGSHKGMGMILRETDSTGKLTGRMIQFHPGGGHHGAEAYWKVSSAAAGTARAHYGAGGGW